MKHIHYWLWVAVAIVPGVFLLSTPSPWVALVWVWSMTSWAAEMRIRAEIAEDIKKAFKVEQK